MEVCETLNLNILTGFLMRVWLLFSRHLNPGSSLKSKTLLEQVCVGNHYDREKVPRVVSRLHKSHICSVFIFFLKLQFYFSYDIFRKAFQDGTVSVLYICFKLET